MRTVKLSTGATGITAAHHSTKPLVFVLMDDDDEQESNAAWFLETDVTFV